MLFRLTIGAFAALMLAACAYPMPGPTPGPSIGVGNPYPVSNYDCDGTQGVSVGERRRRCRSSSHGSVGHDILQRAPDADHRTGPYVLGHGARDAGCLQRRLTERAAGERHARTSCNDHPCVMPRRLRTCS